MVLLVLLVPGPTARAEPPAGATGAGVITGVVRDARGAPIAGATVSLNVGRPADQPGSWVGDVRTTTTDGSGRYRFEGVDPPDERHQVWGVSASAADFASARVEDVGERMRAAPGTPVVADLVLRRLDVTLRGRVSVRGGEVGWGWVTVRDAASDGRYGADTWTTSVQGDGRWELRVPAGAYRISASSTYGLETWWPDVAGARPGPVTRTVAAGEVVDGLDVSMRLRLPGPAVDEYGTQHWGWDSSASQETGRYPRDSYRSPSVVRGAQLALGTPRSAFYFPLPRLPAGDLVTVTGHGIPVEIPVENTGDDVLWFGPVRLAGEIAADSTCTVGFYRPCDQEQPVEPGETAIVRITSVTSRWAPRHDLEATIPTSVGPDLRIPLSLRNVGSEEFGPDDVRNLRGIHQYLSDEDQWRQGGILGVAPPLPPELTAWLRSLAPPAPAPAAAAPVRRAPAIGVVTVRRTSVRFTFPAAGRIDVRLDRLVRSKDRRRPDRWTRARSVTLRATRAGARTVRIERLTIGPYRVRITARIGGRVRRVTDYRDVKG